MKIRPAIETDSPLLSSLSTDVQRLHARHHPGIFRMPESEEYAVSFFEQMLTDPAVHIFIAEESRNAVGYVVCKLIERPETPFTFAARTLLVDQISVRPEMHGRGAGRALFEQADALARELRVERIHLGSWDFNLGAHAFFEKMGFRKFVFRYWKLL